MPYYNVTIPIIGKAIVLTDADNAEDAISNAIDDYDHDSFAYLRVDDDAATNQFKVEPCDENGDPLPSATPAEGQ